MTKRIYTILLIGLLIISSLIGAILAYNGVSVSYYATLVDDSPMVLMKDSMLVHILFAVLLGSMVCVLDAFYSKKLSVKTQERIAGIVLVFSMIVIAIVGTIYVQANPYYPQGDQLNTTAGAFYCKSGDYSMLQKGGYIGLYEQQKGFMFLYEILFTLFGDFCYKVAAEFHVLFAVLTVWAGYGFVKIQFERPVARILYCLLMTVCLPYFLFLPYIYGDIPSICFCMILFWALSKYAQQYRKRYVLLAAVMAALALMCRMNTWIVLIAIGIGMVLLTIYKKNYRPLVAAICVILVAFLTIKAIDLMYEKRSGYESSVGIPSILWVAMGLQETNGEAGTYNRYQQSVFESNDFDREISAQIGKDYITVRLQEFRENPDMAKDFFWKKMSSQWMEPLFESLASTKSFEKDKPVPEWIQNLYYGSVGDTAWKLANYYQSFIYVAFFLFGVGRFMTLSGENKSSVKWIPLIAIVGGFLFSLIWENQCRYCLPYYVFMLLYVPEGVLQWKDLFGRMPGKKKQTN